LVFSWAQSAHAQSNAQAQAQAPSVIGGRAESTPALSPSESIDASEPAAPAPPPLDIPYVQYGVAFTTELVITTGSMCSDATRCVLGSGGGFAARLGRRSAGPWYFGGAYELTKQNPNSLYRFATLQQLRSEVRWYKATGLDTQPYASAGFGFVGYGNEWSVDTWGPAAFLGIGLESQLSRRTVVGVALTYRAVGLKSFFDTSNAFHPASVSSFMSLELSLEERDPIVQRSSSSNPNANTTGSTTTAGSVSGDR
jgi:hypothetical protein